jgi:ribA/ribD-fused uncharacterized protein
MMYQKAVLFGDYKVAKTVLTAGHPRKVKALGRKVANFDEKLWCENRDRIVKEGNICKFTLAVEEPKHATLREMLLATGDKELVEASPFDRIWGVGFDPKTAADNRESWGLNLLGKALMEVRTILKEDDDDKDEKEEK